MCLTPFSKRDKFTGESQTFPCGKCPQCTARRISAWSFRLMQQDKVCTSAYFVTLTYNTDHVPITPNGFMTLKKEDVQNYMKRLRKLSPNANIKYYTAGEYGGKTNRPHYHILLFNAGAFEITKAWSLDGRSLGDVHFGTVTAASVGYSLKYISKPKRIPMHARDDRLREFQLTSKGLGSNYLNAQVTEWHTQDLTNRMYLNIEGGKKIAMPRYYKDKIYDEHQRQTIANHFRIEKSKEPLLTSTEERNKAQAVAAAFRRADHNSTKGDRL